MARRGKKNSRLQHSKILSDCCQFISVAFNVYDLTMLSAVQIRDRCQFALDALPDMNRQLNCIRSLQYLNRYAMLPTNETEHLNLTECNGRVRSNYLSQKHLI